MQPINFFQATRLAGTLSSDGKPIPNVSEKDLADYHPIMISLPKVRDLIRIMTVEDLPTLRLMFAAELTRPAGPRVNILGVLLRRHEDLYSQQRTQQIMDELPAFAVFMDRPNMPVGKVGGAALQNIVTRALHNAPEN